MCGTSVMLGCACAALISACETAQPVASSTCTMRRWLWPPSRVRVPAFGNRFAGIEWHTQFSQPVDGGTGIAATYSTVARWLRPAPATIVSSTCAATVSPASSTAADAALRPGGGAISQIALGQHGHRAMFGQVQCRGQPGGARSHHDGIEMAGLRRRFCHWSVPGTHLPDRLRGWKPPPRPARRWPASPARRRHCCGACHR